MGFIGDKVNSFLQLLKNSSSSGRIAICYGPLLAVGLLLSMFVSVLFFLLVLSGGLLAIYVLESRWQQKPYLGYWSYFKIGLLSICLSSILLAGVFCLNLNKVNALYGHKFRSAQVEAINKQKISDAQKAALLERLNSKIGLLQFFIGSTITLVIFGVVTNALTALVYTTFRVGDKRR